MTNSGTQVLLFTNMAVNMNGEKPLQNMMIDYIIHKGSFQNFIAPNSFLKIQTIVHTVIFHVGGWEMSEMSETQRE